MLYWSILPDLKSSGVVLRLTVVTILSVCVCVSLGFRLRFDSSFYLSIIIIDHGRGETHLMLREHRARNEHLNHFANIYINIHALENLNPQQQTKSLTFEDQLSQF